MLYRGKQKKNYANICIQKNKMIKYRNPSKKFENRKQYVNIEIFVSQYIVSESCSFPLFYLNPGIHFICNLARDCNTVSVVSSKYCQISDCGRTQVTVAVEL